MAALRPKASSMEGQRRQDPARLFAAYSIYHHSNPALDQVRPSLPHFMRPSPLLDAVHQLMDDPGHETHHARKHAAAALARAAVAHPQRDEFVRARDHLLGERGRQFEEHRKLGGNPAVAVHLAMDDAQCDIVDHHTDVNFDPLSFVTRVQVTVKTTRPLDETLAAAADPRAWATPPNDCFAEVFRVEPDGDSYTSLPDGRPFGTPWNGLFYERAQLAWDELAFSVFENILQISFSTDLQRSGSKDDPAIEMNFRLWECLDSRLGPLQRLGGLDVDEGYYRAWATRGKGRVATTTIDTVKAVRYTNPSSGSNVMLPGPPGAWQFINYTAPAVLGYWMDDLACKGACSHVPASSPQPPQPHLLGESNAAIR
ncbi:MAG: hypothetical protein ABI560_00720 [Myxococcales bacterium]